MGLKDRLLAAINGAPEEEFVDEEVVARIASPAPAPVAVPAASDLENRQLRDQLARLQQENSRIKMARVQEKAEAFWSSLLSSHRAVPAEEAGIIKGYISAAVDDEVLPRADGSARIDDFEAMYNARPANMLTAESVPQALNDVILLRNKMQTGASDLYGRTPDGHAMESGRREALLKMTPLGRETLSDRNGKH